MPYADVAAMAADPGLADRIKGCTATQGVGDADTWWYHPQVVPRRVPRLGRSLGLRPELREGVHRPG